MDPELVEYEPYRTFHESKLVARFCAPMDKVNKVRRAILTSIPTFAIETVIYLENTSAQHDDAISQRLGLVPLAHPSLDVQTTEPLMFTLHAQAPADKPLRVMSGHLRPVNHSLKPFSPFLEILKLYPGESIKLVCFAVLHPGSHHVKHTPAHAFHKRGPTPEQVDLVIQCHGSFDARDVLRHALALARP